ncbi:MAG: Gfo/Idh/MocA family oxidoreductase [Planctomycetota bacterium]|nr:Gfo/Idh/MocA family oxidoreductase [Planctomycetota bacterium]MDA1113381.1 Gfo/Idh/MocA family oxidoreductase [Planctomycetota bacterium]
MTRNLPRREFLKTTAAGVAALPILRATAYAGGKDTLRVGLVGCGGRGTGAAFQAIQADPGVVLWSMGDLFADRLESSLGGLNENFAERVDVPAVRQHVGFDAYKQVIAEVDVVLFATPPVFRPMHLAEAVEAGRHVFCEKPVAVDTPGVHSVLKTAKLAKEKGLSLASGFCWRAAYGHRGLYDRILNGNAIGDVRHVYATYLAGGVWYKDRKEEWTDLEYQLRNWYYYSNFSGDHIVEQAIHSVDKILWAKGDEMPVSATAMGGRQVRTAEKYGNIYDHFGVVYEWADGTQGHLLTRQQNGCHSENLDRIVGSDGIAHIDGWANRFVVEGARPWKYEGANNDMYQTEHDELFASIRAGAAMNQGVSMAQSTMAAILGRMSAYTGKRITWEQAMASKENLTPQSWEFGTGIEVVQATPGKTKFV